MEKTSATKSITVTINSLDDPPNSYGAGNTDFRFDKLQYFVGAQRNYSSGWNNHIDGGFYQDGSGSPITVTIKKFYDNRGYLYANGGYMIIFMVIMMQKDMWLALLGLQM